MAARSMVRRPPVAAGSEAEGIALPVAAGAAWPGSREASRIDIRRLWPALRLASSIPVETALVAALLLRSSRTPTRGAPASVPSLTLAAIAEWCGLPRPACGERATRAERKPDFGPVRGRLHKIRLAATPPPPDPIPSPRGHETALPPGHEGAHSSAYNPPP